MRTRRQEVADRVAEHAGAAREDRIGVNRPDDLFKHVKPGISFVFLAVAMTSCAPYLPKDGCGMVSGETAQWQRFIWLFSFILYIGLASSIPLSINMAQGVDDALFI